jgi:hypothetical protein
MTFKNDQAGLKVLNWWRQACIEWCYARKENGKFGDQKYLDDWPQRFESVCELQNLGGGVAPWNVQQYEFGLENNQVMGVERVSAKKFSVIFYHFHQFRFLKNGYLDLAPYKLAQSAIRYIYVPYIKRLESIARKLAIIAPDFNANASLPFELSLKNIAKILLRKLQGRYNVCNKKALEMKECHVL